MIKIQPYLYLAENILQFANEILKQISCFAFVVVNEIGYLGKHLLV